MRIAFQTNTINYRGTTVAIRDYAKYNQEILGNESIIVYPVNFSDPGVPADSLHQPKVIEELEKEFELIGYNSLDELDEICVKRNLDYTYFFKWGFNDGIVTKASKNLIHAVFQCNDPHGDRYAYISKWLSDYCSAGEIDYIPYIVDLPKSPTFCYREKLGIPMDKIVVGRIGGFSEFDIEFAMYAILDIVMKDPDFVFVFVNTRKFLEHPNIIYLDPIFDLQEKTNFINSCNALLHARSRGETFGLAVSEFLFHNKPVFSFNGGIDKNHIEFLKNTGNLYDNKEDLIDKLYRLKGKEIYNYDYKSIVEEFSPKNVIQKFDKVFLS